MSILRGLIRITLLVRGLMRLERVLMGTDMGLPMTIPPPHADTGRLMALAMALKELGRIKCSSILSMRGDFMKSRMTSMKLSSDGRRPLDRRCVRLPYVHVAVAAATFGRASTSSPSKSSCEYVSM